MTKIIAGLLASIVLAVPSVAHADAPSDSAQATATAPALVVDAIDIPTSTLDRSSWG